MGCTLIYIIRIWSLQNIYDFSGALTKAAGPVTGRVFFSLGLNVEQPRSVSMKALSFLLVPSQLQMTCMCTIPRHAGSCSRRVPGSGGDGRLDDRGGAIM